MYGRQAGTGAARRCRWGRYVSHAITTHCHTLHSTLWPSLLAFFSFFVWFNRSVLMLRTEYCEHWCQANTFCTRLSCCHLFPGCSSNNCWWWKAIRKCGHTNHWVLITMLFLRCNSERESRLWVYAALMITQCWHSRVSSACKNTAPGRVKAARDYTTHKAYCLKFLESGTYRKQALEKSSRKILPSKRQWLNW